MAYIQKNNPFSITSCGRRRSFTQGGNPGSDRHKTSRFKKSPIESDKKQNKKDKRTPRQKWIDEGIEKGALPKPNTKELLKEWKKAYFEEKHV